MNINFKIIFFICVFLYIIFDMVYIIVLYIKKKDNADEDSKKSIGYYKNNLMIHAMLFFGFCVWYHIFTRDLTLINKGNLIIRKCKDFNMGNNYIATREDKSVSEMIDMCKKII